MYPVYDIAGSISERPETLGSKEKMWVIPQNPELPKTRHLFKIGRVGTGENWSEKAASELAELMGLPAANYDLAVAHGIRGVLSERFLPQKASLILGNALLGQFVDDYDGGRRYKQVQYTLSRAFSIVSGLHNVTPPRLGQYDLPAIDYFVGYIVFDGLIGNTDRHHENWGFEVDFNADELMPILAPTFDHASSLGRELNDDQRLRRLSTGDIRGNITAYAAKARSAFFGAGDKTLTSRECLMQTKRIKPDSFRFWAEKAIDLNPCTIQEIFNNIPEDWITKISIEFAMALIRENQVMLRKCLA